MLVGAQLYTIRAHMQTPADFAHSLSLIAQMGHKSVQLSGQGPFPAQFMRDALDENGLSCVLTHIAPERLLNDADELIRAHQILGCKYIGLGSMPERYRSPYWYPRFKVDFLPTMQKFRDAGMLFMYHNHHFEFERWGDKLILERMMDDFAPDEMGFTFDTYWAQAGGGDPIKWINLLKGRLPVVHLKDMGVTNGQSVMAPIGEGNLDFPAILKAFEAAGSQYALVEQDICVGSPFDCLQRSLDYLKSLGYE